MVTMKGSTSDESSVYKMEVVLVRKMDCLSALSSDYKMDSMTARMKDLSLDMSLVEMKADMMDGSSD